ncbi:hypothetical protein JZO73_03935 [Enterococcus plantarum]|nr:hypothetical protein [Enterococcus plantarum]
MNHENFTTIDPAQTAIFNFIEAYKKTKLYYISVIKK